MKMQLEEMDINIILWALETEKKSRPHFKYLCKKEGLYDFRLNNLIEYFTLKLKYIDVKKKQNKKEKKKKLVKKNECA